MKIIKFLAVVLATVSLNAQNTKENLEQQKGYYITAIGNRVNGYYKTTDFLDAESLQFKKTETEPYTTLDVSTVTEYGIGTEFKFIKRTFQFDDTETSMKRLDTQSTPNWVTTTGFLNVLVEGEASLYSYRGKNGTKFFYNIKSKEEVPIEQLFYKRYRISQTSISENRVYLQQLLRDVRCEDQERSYFAKVKYDKKPLIRVFKQYNECIGEDYTAYNNSTGKNFEISITAYAGAHLTSFKVNSPEADSDAEGLLSPAVGVEFALVFPSEKWAFLGRVEFENLSGETEGNYERGFANNITDIYELDAQAINVQVGVRHNFARKDKSNFFVDGMVCASIPYGEIVKRTVVNTDGGNSFERPGETFDLQTSFCLNFGLGYTYQNKYGVALRYETGRNMFTNLPTTSTTSISRLGLNFRYTFY